MEINVIASLDILKMEHLYVQLATKIVKNAQGIFFITLTSLEINTKKRLFQVNTVFKDTFFSFDVKTASTAATKK